MGTSRDIQKRPLRLILLVGLALRILAAFTARVPRRRSFPRRETGASWAVGEDYNNWMPWTQRANGIENPTPHRFNLAYAGIVSGYFRVCNAVGFVTRPAKCFSCVCFMDCSACSSWHWGSA